MKNMEEFYKKLAESVTYTKKGNKYRAGGFDSRLSLIGEGRSACAFRIEDSLKVLKVYYPEFYEVAEVETSIYRKLSDVHSFPVFYSSGKNYIVIDYIEGSTFFQCLTHGIFIAESVIHEVDKALQEVVARELRPSDIHLHNLIMTPEGTVKIIDVARFNEEKDCTQWNDLRAAYFKLYVHRLFPKRVPAVVLNSVRLLYKKNLLKI
ncbi:protein kinase family protein [Alkalicoccus halolimnae]|uniref:Protein kinase family protein n=1 Tax=Alkalicoccus halolimnae TaxID=1667239 RepID=A0A5C7FL33_9BACI|nr:protein kinase family protein [Alkalicoccus halolimnae]TXF86799.1 protein kinase family protein [Alkalicoccus halolimnae]